MTDFVQTSETKRAVRTLSNPIADETTFNTIVQSVITQNPFGCVAYMTAGENHPAVEKTKEAYTARIVYQDTDALIVGTGTHRFDSLAGFSAGAPAIVSAAAITSAHGGTAVHDADNDTYSATVKCHDANGEIYSVVFSRDQVTLSSYEDEAIRTKVETWADTVPELA
ncbi:MAG: hypothetical protein ABSG28_03615 [Methanoregula sp.]|jgi:hypothetical protein|uniref:hypothetical protein n=1 Tax=Methanoregula sp. TaxID=2052170 RepID=UPI003C1CF512